MKKILISLILLLSLSMVACGGDWNADSNIKENTTADLTAANTTGDTTDIPSVTSEATPTSKAKATNTPSPTMSAKDAKLTSMAKLTDAAKITKAPTPTKELKPVLTLVPTAFATPTPNASTDLSQNKHDSIEVQYATFLSYETGGKKYGLYGFDKAVTRGSVKRDDLSKYSCTSVNYEANYGTTAYVKDKTVYIKAYSHNGDHKIIGSQISSDNSKVNITVSYDKYTVIDCSKFSEGLYIVATYFDTKDNPINAYIYVAKNGVWLARLTNGQFSVSGGVKSYNDMTKALKDAKTDPKNCLKIDDIVYPCKDNGTDHRCDTDEYINLSHKLLDGHPDWSDEYKVFVLTNWFLDNITYDDWKVKNGSSRAMTFHVWDGTYSMWNMHVGVCADFSNAMVIMLREQGIPCTSFESKGHMWNVVYLNGHWIPLDITPMLSKHTNALDGHVTSTKGTKYNEYLSYHIMDKIVSVGDDIWTIERSMRKK